MPKSCKGFDTVLLGVMQQVRYKCCFVYRMSDVKALFFDFSVKPYRCVLLETRRCGFTCICPAVRFYIGHGINKKEDLILTVQLVYSVAVCFELYITLID